MKKRVAREIPIPGPQTRFSGATVLGDLPDHVAAALADEASYSAETADQRARLAEAALALGWTWERLDRLAPDLAEAFAEMGDVKGARRWLQTTWLRSPSRRVSTTLQVLDRIRPQVTSPQLNKVMAAVPPSVRPAISAALAR